MTIQTGGKKFLTRVILATAALLGMMASARAPRHLPKVTISASAASPKPTTDSTKPWSITAGTAGKRTARATICTSAGTLHGESDIAGGRGWPSLAFRSVIGMTRSRPRSPRHEECSQRTMVLLAEAPRLGRGALLIHLDLFVPKASPYMYQQLP